MLKVLIVDDTIFFRKIVSDILSEMQDVEVVGTANNGKIALSKIDTHAPDLLILDVEMPEASGIQVLEYIKENNLRVGAIMLSSLTQKSSDATMKALELGAFDFIPKPQAGSLSDNKKAVKKEILSKVKAFQKVKDVRNILNKKPANLKNRIKRKKIVSHLKSYQKNKSFIRKKQKSEIIAIGISTGGPCALAQVIPKLKKDIGVPILIAQHMPPVFTKSLASSLDSKSSLNVKEAVDGELLRDDTVFIAPGGKHMKVAASADGQSRMIRVTDDPPENSCKPSVDYLFRSIARYYIGRATCVIMTGMGSDGTSGLKKVKEAGGIIIAQNEETCVVYGMPKEPIQSGIVDIITSLDQIAFEIMQTTLKS